MATSAPFPVPASHLGHHMTFSCRLSLGSPWLWPLLSLPLNLMTLPVLSSTGQVFCIMFFNWDLPVSFPLMISLGLWLLIGGPQRYRATLTASHTCCQHGSPCGADLGPPAGAVSVSLLQSQVALPAPTLSSLGGRRYMHVTLLKGEQLCPTSLKVNCLHILCGIVLQGRFLYSPPLMCSCIFI